MKSMLQWLGQIPIPTVPAIALAISLLALFVAIRNYARKSGTQVRGSYGACSTVNCDDTYVSNVVLENVKDRAVSIFGIYLQVGHNYYVTVEEFDTEPVILRPYETRRFEYGPIEIYAVSSTRVDINEMIQNDKVRKRLVLSTTDGRYNVPSRIRPWNPIGSMFSNQLTGVLRPIRNTYNGEAVGGNVRYIIHFVNGNGKDEVVHLRAEDYRYNKFRNFRLTRQSLESRDSLEAFLEEVKREGKLNSTFMVHDLTSWREKELEFYSKRSVHIAKPISWFTYYIVGRFVTLRADRKRRAGNKRLRERNVSQPKQAAPESGSQLPKPAAQVSDESPSANSSVDQP